MKGNDMFASILRITTVATLCLAGLAPAHSADLDWTVIDDPAEVRALFDGKTVLMYKTRPQFYRADGNLVEFFRSEDYYAVKKWTVNEAGQLCWVFHAIPDKVIDCAVISRNPDQPAMYGYNWVNLEYQRSPFEFIDGPTPKMVEELNKVAGPLN